MRHPTIGMTAPRTAEACGDRLPGAQEEMPDIPQEQKDFGAYAPHGIVERVLDVTRQATDSC